MWALLDRLAVTTDPNIRRAIGLAMTALGRRPIPERQLEKWKVLVGIFS